MNSSVTRVASAIGLIFALCALGGYSTIASASDEDEASHVAELQAWAEGEGIPYDEAVRRDELRTAADPLYAFISGHPNDFGGIYQTDGPSPWSIVVLSLDEPSSATKDLAPTDVPIAWERATFSVAELDATISKLKSEWNRDAPAAVSGAVVDVAANRIMVEVVGSIDQPLVDDIRGRYGRIVDFKSVDKPLPVSCTATTDPWNESRYQCTPGRGGIELEISSASHSGHCTQTLWMKNFDASIMRVTAAHCGNWTASQTFWHNGVSTGTAVHANSTISGGTSTNSDAWKWTSTANTTVMDRIYLSPAAPTYNVNAIPQTPGFTGDRRCVSGVGNNPFALDPDPQTCGTLKYSTVATQRIDGVWISASRCDCNGDAADGTGLTGGDSGAPIYSSNSLWGLAVLDNGDYSLAYIIESDLSATFCLTADCN